jgi:hypothetical protein
MRKKALLLAAVVAAAWSVIPVVRAQSPVFDSTLIPEYIHVRATLCDPMDDSVGAITSATPLNSVLFHHNRNVAASAPPGTAAPPATCAPVFAPDGHQLTLGEFRSVSGGALVKCTDDGTQTVVRVSGLQVKGTYTLWMATPNPIPMDPNPTRATFSSVGSLGRAGAAENLLIVSANGDATIARTTPEQDQSAFGHIGPCGLLGALEIHLVYHTDGMTHGNVPGPVSTWVLNARFRIP